MSEYPQSPSNQSPDYEDEIDLRERIRVLWQASSGSSARAEALPVARGGGSGGLASLAGVNIPSGESNQKNQWQCNTSVAAIHGGFCGAPRPPL